MNWRNFSTQTFKRENEPKWKINSEPILLTERTQIYESVYSVMFLVRERDLDLELATLYKIWHHHWISCSWLLFLLTTMFSLHVFSFLPIPLSSKSNVTTSVTHSWPQWLKWSLYPASFPSHQAVIVFSGHSQACNYCICLFTFFHLFCLVECKQHTHTHTKGLSYLKSKVLRMK